MNDEHYDKIKEILDSGFPIDQIIPTRPGKSSALHIACQYGAKKIASLLLSRGAPIESIDDYGRTPLHTACMEGYKSIVSELLKNGGDLNAKDEVGETPLYFASHYRRGEIVVEILKHLSETSSRDHFKSEVKKARASWDKWQRGKKLSSVLKRELMASFEYNLSTNRENNEKGAR